MSLNKFTDPEKDKKWMNIRCNECNCENLDLRDVDFCALEGKVSLPNVNSSIGNIAFQNRGDGVYEWDAYFLNQWGQDGRPANKRQGKLLEVAKRFNPADGTNTWGIKYIGDDTARIEFHLELWLANVDDNNNPFSGRIPDGCLLDLRILKVDENFNITSLRNLPKYRIHNNQLNLSHEYIYELNKNDFITFRLEDGQNGNDIDAVNKFARIRNIGMSAKITSIN